MKWILFMYLSKGVGYQASGGPVYMEAISLSQCRDLEKTVRAKHEKEARGYVDYSACIERDSL